MDKENVPEVGNLERGNTGDSDILDKLYKTEEKKVRKRKKVHTVDFDQEPDYEIVDDSNVRVGLRPDKLTRNIAIAALLGLIFILLDLHLSSPLTLLKNEIMGEWYHDGFAGFLYILGSSRILLITGILSLAYAFWCWKRLEDYKLAQKH